MVYERGGHLLSYTTEYQSLFDGNNNNFDAESEQAAGMTA
jgi:hypothetical protein